jgi:hypothetical protein
MCKLAQNKSVMSIFSSQFILRSFLLWCAHQKTLQMVALQQAVAQSPARSVAMQNALDAATD